MKLLRLAICDIEYNRAAQRAKDQAKKAKQQGKTLRATAGSRLVEGAGTRGRNQALQPLALTFP